MSKTCPPGTFLQSNGVCGTGQAETGPLAPTWCGPQYTGKKCCFQNQLVTGVTRNIESKPNVICAYRDGDFQYACDPGCCTSECAEFDTPPVQKSKSTPITLPIWAILLITFGIIGIILIAVYFRYRK